MNHNDNFFNRELPKWPALIVKGNNVSKEQAKEIIIRTTRLNFCTNDYAFAKILYEYIYKIKIPGHVNYITLFDLSSYFIQTLESKKLDISYVGDPPLGLAHSEYRILCLNYYTDVIKYNKIISKYDKDFDIKALESKIKNVNFLYENERVSDLMYDVIETKYKPLDLAYLENSQILSSWIGGPHGWCNWDGNIGCNNYNIGKWPSVKMVYDEWVKIAKEFPYLTLESQLLSTETCGDENDELGNAIVQFNIKDGLVDMSESTFKATTENDQINWFMSVLNNRHGERGCTFEQFKDALDYVENKFKSKLKLK
jgi:hypothetical protein